MPPEAQGTLRDAPGARPSRRRVSGSRAAAADGDSVCRGPVRQSGIRVEAVRCAVESRRDGTSDAKANRCPLWCCWPCDSNCLTHFANLSQFGIEHCDRICYNVAHL